MNIRLILICLFTLVVSSSVLAQYKLTVNFQQMNPHVNQRLELRVVDNADSKEVGRTVVTSISAADFSLELYTLVEGHSYNVDFFADLNNNGVYDAPPTDHAWRLTLDNATEDTALTFAHNMNFTDILWPGPIGIGTYEAIWGGRWRNLTFSTTDSIKANININADSIKTSFTTKGVLGDPAEVTFTLNQSRAANFDWTTDTLRLKPQNDPWLGEVTLTNGQISGSLKIFDSFFQDTVSIDLTGSFGATQMVATYIVNSSSTGFLANGYFVVNEGTVLVDIPTSVAEQTISNLPDDFSLQQNYPNPFNPSTTISFDVPEASEIKLTVYNVRGQLIQTLHSGVVAAGQHSVVWNGKDFRGAKVASGVYVYKLESKENVLSRKLAFVK